MKITKFRRISISEYGKSEWGESWEPFYDEDGEIIHEVGDEKWHSDSVWNETLDEVIQQFQQTINDINK